MTSVTFCAFLAVFCIDVRLPAAYDAQHRILNSWWFSQAVLALKVEQLSAMYATPYRRRFAVRKPSAQTFKLCKSTNQ
jgi:hypothetical protein